MSEFPKWSSGAVDNRRPAALTRRQWLLRLGEAAALAGFGGIAPEDLKAAGAGPIVSAAELQMASRPAAQGPLPPGLYDASADHLTHVLMRDERFVTIPPGSETEYAQPHAQPYSPRFFSHEEFQVVRQLVRLMLNTLPDAGQDRHEAPAPAPVGTETVDEVAEWIDLAVAQSALVRQAARSLSAQHRTLAIRYYGAEEVQQRETSDPQKTWKDGLAWLQEECSRLAGGSFLDLSEAEQSNTLSRVEKSTYAAAQAVGPGPQLYLLLKRQVMEGYYTSQAGLKELDDQGNAFHGESPGCPDK
jgi:Gluconate 2-dehydrogenase subunit 3